MSFFFKHTCDYLRIYLGRYVKLYVNRSKVILMVKIKMVRTKASHARTQVIFLPGTKISRDNPT